jgi:hypothetical protein
MDDYGEEGEYDQNGFISDDDEKDALGRKIFNEDDFSDYDEEGEDEFDESESEEVQVPAN